MTTLTKLESVKKALEALCYTGSNVQAGTHQALATLDEAIKEVGNLEAAFSVVKNHAVHQDCGRMCDANPAFVWHDQHERSKKYVEGLIRLAVPQPPAESEGR